MTERQCNDIFCNDTDAFEITLDLQIYQFVSGNQVGTFGVYYPAKQQNA